MAADAKWLKENLGTSPEALVGEPAPEDQGKRDLELERIEFDSDSPEAEALLALQPAGPPRLPTFLELPWPKGLEPKPVQEAPSGESLPRADVLVVTWTKEEGHALSRVLTPGFDSRIPTKSDPGDPRLQHWKPYTKGFDAIAAKMSGGCPAVQAGRLGTYWQTEIGERSVVVFKSDSHMSQDDGSRDPETTPNRLVWAQIIADTKPGLVITTGTGGGIGKGMEVGDVVASRFVAFDPHATDPNGQLVPYSCATDAPGQPYSRSMQLIEPNIEFLPKTNSRPPKIVQAGAPNEGIVTTRKFAYDDTANTFHLKGKGGICEMGDAVLGLVCEQLGDAAPTYAIVRNASDPEIDASVPNPGDVANAIYMAYGRWSTVCSAIVCWEIIAST